MSTERGALFGHFGGRKNFNGYLGVILLSAYALRVGAPFLEYAGMILLALGFTQAVTVIEDRDKRRGGDQ